MEHLLPQVVAEKDVNWLAQGDHIGKGPTPLAVAACLTFAMSSGFSQLMRSPPPSWITPQEAAIFPPCPEFSRIFNFLRKPRYARDD
jgi:hypothetical protein